MATLALPISLSSARADSTTFSDEDTLVERTKKLNALMGTNFQVDVKYPKEWETERFPVSRDELLGAQFPRLLWDMRHPFQWSVHLRQYGVQCTHSMTPLEFFHFTSQWAWDFRVKKAAQ